MSRDTARSEFARLPIKGRLRTLYTGLIAWAARSLLDGSREPHVVGEFIADQPQENTTYGIHQFRVRIPGDKEIYRVLIAPADAPISIGCGPADLHFAEPMLPPNGGVLRVVGAAE